MLAPGRQSPDRAPRGCRTAGVTGGAAGRSGRGADAGAQVEDVRPDRVGLGGGRCRPVEHSLQRELASVAYDPDGTGLGDLPFEAVAFSAIFTGDGDSHRSCRVAPGVLRTGPPTVATRIPHGNESPTSESRDASQPRTRGSATLGVIAFGTGVRARQSHHRDRSAGTPAPFPHWIDNQQAGILVPPQHQRGETAKEKLDRDPGP
jgi:hypothetical protein